MADKNDKEQDSGSSIDYAALRKATLGGVTDIPFTHLISEPLKACVIAQNESHQTTIAALREMGLFSDKENNQVASSVGFEFVKDGKRQKIMVPLITLVPINFFQINAASISFKASIKSSSSWATGPDIALELNKSKKEEKKKSSGQEEEGQTSENTSSEGADDKSDEKKQKKGKTSEESSENTLSKDADDKSDEKKDDPTWWREVIKYGGQALDFYKEYKKSKDAKDSESKAEYSNKKDSKVTQESKYCIETTVDFAIQATPADMPGGLAKIIETLNNAIVTFDPSGELQVAPEPTSNGRKVFVRYLNEDGIFDPSAIKCTPNDDVKSQETETGITLTFSKPGDYKIEAGKKKQNITVSE